MQIVVDSLKGVMYYQNMNKAQQDRAENITGKELAKVFRYMPQDELKQYAARGSKAAKRELAKRRKNGEV